MKKQITLFAIFTTLSLFSFSQGTWTKKTDFTGMSRTGACGFSIGAKGYIGTGANAGNYLTDFWAYDTETDSWTQVADLSGPGRQYAVAFAIGERGYVGTGWSTGSIYMKTFWEYDPSTNTWTEKASLPGTPRALAVAFTIGNNGYIGTGLNENPLSDFWKYDPSTDSWTQIADYGGGKRKAAVAFVIGNRGFVGSGYCCGQGQNDFWEYNPVTDEWSEKADMPGALRIYACAFSIGLKGYVGTGNRAYHCCGDFGPALRDFWEFNSQTNTWKQIAPPNAGKRTRAIGITINGRGFFGLGYSTDYENDFHEYVAHDSQKTQEVLNDPIVIFNLYPNPSSGNFTLDLQLNKEETSQAQLQLVNMLSQTVSMESGQLTIENGRLMKEIQLGDVADGMYLVKVIIGNKVFTAQIDLQK